MADSTLLATIPIRSSLAIFMPPRGEGLKSKPQNGTAVGVSAFLNSAGVSKKRIDFRKRQTLFSQGEPAKQVLYIQEGSIKVAVTSPAGKEAVVAILGSGDFLGEACLVGSHCGSRPRRQ